MGAVLGRARDECRRKAALAGRGKIAIMGGDEANFSWGETQYVPCLPVDLRRCLRCALSYHDARGRARAFQCGHSIVRWTLKAAPYFGLSRRAEVGRYR